MSTKKLKIVMSQLTGEAKSTGCRLSEKKKD
jgi:hypothetical protein